jgi:hypothetical protein
MNPKKNYRRYRVSVSIHDLDSSICRSTHSLGSEYPGEDSPTLRQPEAIFPYAESTRK